MTCFVAVVMVVGFTAAPVAAIDVGVSVDEDDGLTVESGDEDVAVDGDELDEGDTSDLDSIVAELENNDDVDLEAIVEELENQDDADIDALIEELENQDDADIDALIEELENQDDADLDAILAALDDEGVADVAPVDTGDAPDAPVDTGDAPADSSDAPVPEEVCTDAGETIEEEVPIEEVPWLSDLPEEAQPPNVPAELVTPRTVVAIVTGASPNQCEVQDPNDPSYDPASDGVDPDASVTPAQGDYKDGSWGVVVYEATLDQSGSGPSASGMIWTLGSSEDGTVDPQVTINDGEKDYEINPTVGYGADGTGHADIEAWAINRRAGTGIDCNGEECQPDASGVPATDAPAVPAPTGQGEDDDSNQSDSEFPEEICTDVPEEFHNNVPWSDLPWISDLPEEAQPPNVPADLVTPRTASSIVVGVTPNQCEVQDPNDPSYDPREDDVDPDASVTPAQGDAGDGSWGLVVYEATLDQSGDGPGIEGMIWTVGTSEYGTADADVTINDGEKDYAVNPEIGYSDDGAGYADIEVRAIGKRAGTGVDCDGEECQPDASGVPATGAPAVPAPTGQDGDDDSSQSDTEIPQEVCTDAGDQVHDEVPWSDIPWLDQLPSEAQPPGVPTTIVTPRAVSDIVWGITPNQCDIQDPNDPTYDPREDDLDPDASVTPAQGDYKDGVWGLLVYEATLDQSGSGPSASGMIWTLASSEDGQVNPDVTINDGEKDYAVNPRVDYSSDGTAYAVTDFWVYGKTFGVEFDCDGEECHPDTRSLPKFEEYPSIPAPTDQNSDE